MIHFDDEKWSSNVWNNVQMQGISISCRYNGGGQRVHNEPKRERRKRKGLTYIQKVRWDSRMLMNRVILISISGPCFGWYNREHPRKKKSGGTALHSGMGCLPSSPY